MHKYYCKKCNNIIGKWDNKYKFYYSSNLCKYTQSKHNDLIFFLNCKNCDKFVGIECWNVCKNYFGKYEIYGEEKLFNFFLKYKKTIEKYTDMYCLCKICNKNKFRCQLWFFEELTFYK